MAELRSTPSLLALSSSKGKTAPAVDKANVRCCLDLSLEFDFASHNVPLNSTSFKVPGVTS